MRSNGPEPVPELLPELLRGVWRRAWIRAADGAVDDSSTVLWLQLESKMVDVRFPPGHGSLADRGSLLGCSVDDLRLLATNESSSGYTTCTPLEVDEHGVSTATAEWFSGGADGVSFQTVSNYPEPGLMELNRAGTILTERAPSGAYVEEWHRLSGSSEPLRVSSVGDGGQLFVAGPAAVLVRDRRPAMPPSVPLAELVIEAGDDLEVLRSLVDCEFSLSLQAEDGRYVITASTFPWRIGETLHVID